MYHLKLKTTTERTRQTNEQKLTGTDSSVVVTQDSGGGGRAANGKGDQINTQ